MKAHVIVVSSVATFVALSGGCVSASDHLLGLEVGGGPAGGLVPEGGPDATRDGAFTLTSYCPSSTCPAGLTTCPDSRFPCDVDLRTDPNNCGTCGFACPKKALNALFSCVEGQCRMTCDASFEVFRPLDCDGLVDNGCELTPTTNDNCGDCGVKCLEPDTCMYWMMDSGYHCGCSGIICYGAYCVDPSLLRNNDDACGDCDVACDPSGGGGPARTNAHYGCIDGKCGHLKCDGGFLDCNDNMVDDGCETSMLSRDNCGRCGEVCPPDQECLLNTQGTPECMCPAGQTACRYSLVRWKCVDVTSDPLNCGGCGFVCPGDPQYATPGLSPICRYGSCGTTCAEGTADCNGSINDGCEIDTNSDPRNCGACGNTCDAVAGQACVGGRCVVEPCEQNGGIPQ